MSTRGDVLELAILGELLVAPLHGYELRKRMNTTLGTIRTLSYGSLYPCLKRLVSGGWIEEADASGHRGLAGRRARIVYRLTDAGRRRLTDSLAEVDPAAWDDESFTVRFSLFAETHPAARLQVLEGRRARMMQRRAKLRQQLQNSRSRWDRYTVELQQHSLDQLEREIDWLDDLIGAERNAGTPPDAEPASAQAAETDPAHHVTTATNAKAQGAVAPSTRGRHVAAMPDTPARYPKEN